MSFLYDKRLAEIITCPRCFTRYAVRAFDLVSVQKTRCSYCRHVWLHYYIDETATNSATETWVDSKSILQVGKPHQVSGKRSLENKEILSTSKPHSALEGTNRKPVKDLNSVSDITKIPENSRGFAMLLMVLFALIVSFSGLTFRSMENADIWQISIFRALALIVSVFVVIFVKYRKEVFLRLFGIGFPGFFAGSMLGGAQLSYMEAMANTTIANTTFTLCSIPFLTAILARVFLQESLSRSTLITMFSAAIGVSIMVWEGISSGSVYGNMMALLTALMFSSFAITVRKNRGLDMVPALLVSGFVNLVAGLAVTGGNFSISTHDMLLSFFWGAIIQSFAFSLFIISSRHLFAAEVTLFSLLEFSLGPVWVWLIINEIPTWISLVGGGVVISAVLTRTLVELVSYTSRREDRQQIPP